MKIDRIWTGNWENAIHGMRHAMESYDKSDSEFANYGTMMILGKNDLDLAQRLVKAGTPHDKFMRQIFFSADVTAPLYWWKEMDTYKVATVANSTSTMHKLASTPITLDCFETDDFNSDLEIEPFESETDDGNNVYTVSFSYDTEEMANSIIEDLENLRQKYLETKDIRYWKELIRWLPESWLQTRTWTANYATLRQIYHWRKDHKLSEWHTFCDMIKSLPYANELLLLEN